MLKYFLPVFLLLANSCFAVELPPPEALLQSIKQEGTAKVMQRLWSRKDLFYQLSTEVASGDPKWLEVARQLKPGCDAASSEILSMSVALALPAAPAAVLSMAGKEFGIREICTLPFWEDESSKEEEVVYLLKAEKALSDLNEPDLEKVRLACMWEIQSWLNKTLSD